MSTAVENFVDIEDAVALFLSTGNIGTAPGAVRAGELPADITYPAALVCRVAGGDDRVTDYPSFDVDFIAPDYTTASTVARAGHRRIKALKPRGMAQKPQILVPVDTGGTVSFVVDRLEVVEAPVRRDYEDSSLRRLTGRYRIEHRCTAAN